MSKKNKAIFDRGSALIITILLVTVLAAIAFSTSRLTISEIVQTGQLEDSELAYQAAEGCVETGLLLYRYNRNAEVPANLDEGMSEDVNEYMYIDISTGDIVDKNTFDLRSADQSYCTLRMWHKRDAGEIEEVTTSACDLEKKTAGLCAEVASDKVVEVCGDNSTNCYEEDGVYYAVPALRQDEAVEYDLVDDQGGIEYNVSGVDSIAFSWEYMGPLSLPEFCNTYPEKCSGDDMQTQYQNYKDSFQILYIPYDENGEVILDDKRPINYGEYQPYDLPTNQAKKIRIKPFGGSLETYELDASDNTEFKMDSRYTYIESTGYYGSAKRKLKTTLDRKTSSILSTYDFLLYSSEEKR